MERRENEMSNVIGHAVSKNALERDFLSIGDVTSADEKISFFIHKKLGRGIAIRHNEHGKKYDLALDIIFSDSDQKFTTRVFNTCDPDAIKVALWNAMQSNADKVSISGFSLLFTKSEPEMFKAAVSREQLLSFLLVRSCETVLKTIVKKFEDSKRNKAMHQSNFTSTADKKSSSKVKVIDLDIDVKSFSICSANDDPYSACDEDLSTAA